MDTSRGKAFAWLGHPVTLAALVVMVVNDHVLKAAFPGLVTGKLSDAAGLVLAPPLAAAVLGLRGRWVAVGVVGTLFTIVKAWPYAAEQASALWSLVWATHIRADWTDLLTLPFLGVAAWTWQSTRRRPPAGRLTRALRVAVLLPLALVGVAATSPAQHWSAVRVASADDTIYLASQNLAASNDRLYWSRTRDLGATWQRVEGTENLAALEENFPQPARLVCSPSNQRTCYRVITDAIGVQASADGGGVWTDSWRIGDRDRERLARTYGGKQDPDEVLVSSSIIVHDTKDGVGRHVVAVANGRDGFAIRDATGNWTRIGFPTLGPDADSLPQLGRSSSYYTQITIGVTVAAIILMAGLIVSFGGAWAASRSAGRFSPWWIAPVALVIVAPCLLSVGVAGDRSELFTWPMAVLGVLTGVVAPLILAATVTMALVRHGNRSRWWWATITWGAGALTAVIGAVIWLTWPGADQFGLGRTMLFALLGLVPGLVIAGIAAQRIQPRAHA